MNYFFVYDNLSDVGFSLQKTKNVKKIESAQQ
jgi:hypothetical protein